MLIYKYIKFMKKKFQINNFLKYIKCINMNYKTMVSNLKHSKHYMHI